MDACDLGMLPFGLCFLPRYVSCAAALDGLSQLLLDFGLLFRGINGLLGQQWKARGLLWLRLKFFYKWLAGRICVQLGCQSLAGMGINNPPYP